MHSGQREIEYGKKDVPEIKLTLYLEGRAVYSLTSDSLKNYEEEVRTDPMTHTTLPAVHMVDTMMNPDDYEILIARKYDKYVLDVWDYWRCAKDNKDYMFSRQFEFNQMRIRHETRCNGEPSEWNIILENQV